MSDSTSQPHLGQPNRARFCHFQKRLITVTFIFRLNKLLLLKFFPERILYFLSIPVFLCQIYEDSSWHRFIHTVKAPATNFNLALICIARNLISLCVIRCATWSASRKYHRPVCVLRKCISVMKEMTFSFVCHVKYILEKQSSTGSRVCITFLAPAHPLVFRRGYVNTKKVLYCFL